MEARRQIHYHFPPHQPIIIVDTRQRPSIAGRIAEGIANYVMPHEMVVARGEVTDRVSQEEKENRLPPLISLGDPSSQAVAIQTPDVAVHIRDTVTAQRAIGQLGLGALIETAAKAANARATETKARATEAKARATEAKARATEAKARAARNIVLPVLATVAIAFIWLTGGRLVAFAAFKRH
ncbi:hypothetical protein B0H67DRAFT_679729 [Lasiosphaeris hirsuta]|uniref:Uncharacterized protein n=1 Tax=Lasiosphaeris hirsuta TaxID=260670 RepID=A0AA40EBL6_9PEZI|nr:hypothetical protein B0H67DRAFT_679729 [Lasiosphaeris hirsuta]